MKNKTNDIEILVDNWQATTAALLEAIKEKNSQKYEELYTIGNQQFSLLKLIINSQRINELKFFESTITKVIKDWRIISQLLQEWSQDIYSDIKNIQRKKNLNKKFKGIKRQQGSILNIVN